MIALTILRRLHQSYTCDIQKTVKLKRKNLKTKTVKYIKLKLNKTYVLNVQQHQPINIRMHQIFALVKDKQNKHKI